MKLYRGIGIAHWLVLSCAVGLFFLAGPARAGDDADTPEVVMASPEALALSGYDVGDLSDENPPATCNTNKFPGGCINQTGTVTKGKPVILDAFTEIRAGTCNEIGVGEWIELKNPKQGKLSHEVIKGTIKGCGKKAFTFLALIYDWTHPVSKTHDVFSDEWTSTDFPHICPTCRIELNDNLQVATKKE